MARATLTETTNNGAEVYTNRINQYADQYITDILHLDTDNLTADDYKEISASFPDMLLFIRDRITPPSHDDIVLMDEVFDIFVRLCCRCRQLPTLEMYGTLVRTAPSTFSDWLNGEYRKYGEYSKTVKKWKSICQAYLINSLGNGNGTNVVGKIFIAKSAFGMRETAPIADDRPDPNRPTMTPHEILEDIKKRHGLSLSDNGDWISVDDIRPDFAKGEDTDEPPKLVL